MAARLAWVVTQKLEKGGIPRILALMGAAHLAGVRHLLASPLNMRDELRRYGLKFTKPTLIRRVSVN
jgi:hypothetical protein